MESYLWQNYYSRLSLQLSLTSFLTIYHQSCSSGTRAPRSICGKVWLAGCSRPVASYPSNQHSRLWACHFPKQESADRKTAVCHKQLTEGGLSADWDVTPVVLRVNQPVEAACMISGWVLYLCEILMYSSWLGNLLKPDERKRNSLPNWPFNGAK